MAFDPRSGNLAQAAARAGVGTDIDAGLRKYMLSVYNYMALGVALTGIIALVVALNPAIMQAVALGPMKWVLFIGILGLGFFSGKERFDGHGSVSVHGDNWNPGCGRREYFYAECNVPSVPFGCGSSRLCWPDGV